MIQEVKVCSKCKIEKPLSEFSKSISTKDGLQSICKRCVNEYNNKYYE